MSPLARLLALLVRGYQRWISPAMGQHCRFAPSCSHYAVDALTQHGALRGSWFAIRRLLRCHPWNPGGHDPVPGAASDPVPGAGGDPVPPPSAASATMDVTPELRPRRAGAS